METLLIQLCVCVSFLVAKQYMNMSRAASDYCLRQPLQQYTTNQSGSSISLIPMPAG